MPPSSPSPALALGGLALLLLGAACRSAPPAAKTVDDGAPTLETPTGALAALDEAEAQLLDEVAFSVRSDDAENDQAVVDAPEPPTDAAEQPEATSVHRRPRGRCSRACAALASMVRAADRLCQMTGEEEDRCQSARRRVEAGRRIVERHCPTCDA